VEVFLLAELLLLPALVQASVQKTAGHGADRRVIALASIWGALAHSLDLPGTFADEAWAYLMPPSLSRE